MAAAINRLPLLRPKWLNQQRASPQGTDHRALEMVLQRSRRDPLSRGWSRWGRSKQLLPQSGWWVDQHAAVLQELAPAPELGAAHPLLAIAAHQISGGAAGEAVGGRGRGLLLAREGPGGDGEGEHGAFRAVDARHGTLIERQQAQRHDCKQE